SVPGSVGSLPSAIHPRTSSSLTLSSVAYSVGLTSRGPVPISGCSSSGEFTKKLRRIRCRHPDFHHPAVRLTPAGGQYPRTGVARQYGSDRARARRPHSGAGETFG